MGRALTAMWQLFSGLLFYPLMIGLFIWLYLADKHWIFGLIVILVILWVDPIWRIMGRRALEMVSPNKRD